MTLRIEWNLSAERRAVIEPLLLKWIHLAPAWLRSLEVQYMHDGDDVANSATLTRYRDSAFQFGPQWFAMTPHDRERTVVHELLHIPTQALADLLDTVIEHFVPERQQEAWKNQRREAYEAMVTDLELIVLSDGAVRQASVGEHAGGGVAGPSHA